ncbi:MAG: 1-(5-phosphoribosyl)-5-[(5-phosphoribosylamino)methylideneamino]imidazole-4-carboxamide isomerase [Planctomycetes bacterium]|nr:1-(5-phosphoribosyl)-5-[(5-phosphoribosylamino)methylideneamino]imidazole-4-carboxamide isomerase [Planctomycetota bacterium]
MLIIPAVDIKGGKCVRLAQGKADRETVYADDAVSMAKRWEDEGAELLHVVDLDGAFEGKPVNTVLIKAIVSATNLRVEVGGGIRTDEAVQELLAAGVERVVIGTKALESPGWIANLCARHPGHIVLGVDAQDGLVAVKGWTRVSKVPAAQFAAQFDGYNLAATIFTDISRDGMLTGPNIESLKEFMAATRHPVVASGGISSLADVKSLTTLSIAGMIIGKALYAGKLSLAAAISACRP